MLRQPVNDRSPGVAQSQELGHFVGDPGLNALVFSPDSRRLAYMAGVGEKRTVVVDGNEGIPYDGSLEGTRIVFDSANALHYIAISPEPMAGNLRADTYDVYLVEETLY